MKIEDAMRWVNENKGMLARRAAAYTDFAPYAVNDYLQDAYEAAIKAAICCQRNPKLQFEGCFTKIWRDIVASVTPFPDEAREAYKKKKAEGKALREGKPLPVETDAAEEGEKKKTYYSGGTSMSFPLNARKHSANLDMFPIRKSKGGFKIDIERVYSEKVKSLLSPKEAQAMEYSLGITREGKLTEREIAAKMGVSRDTVREYLSRGFQKAKKGKVIDLRSLAGKREATRSVESQGHSMPKEAERKVVNNSP